MVRVGLTDGFSAMTSSDHLLDLIQNTPGIHGLLRSSFSFDVGRKRCGDGLRLASGAPLQAIAGEFASGAYFLCAEENGLRATSLLDMDDAAIDGSHVRALKRWAHSGPSPVGRARPGSKHHLIADMHGAPLAISLTNGNRHDVTQLMPLLDAIPRIRGAHGRPRHRPRQLFADRGYDKYRRLLRARGITPEIARKGTAHGSGLGKNRWGRRPDLRLAPPAQATQNALLDTRRPSPGSTPTRLQHHLLEATPNL